MGLNFDATPEEHALIVKIAERAHGLLYENGEIQNQMTTIMDVTVANNDVGLDLQGLLDADAYDFVHDVGGIRRHLNRQTGIIEDCFYPRYAKTKTTA